MATERTVLVRLKAEVNDFTRGMAEAGAAAKALSSEIDSTSGRSAFLAQSILALAPAAVTLGAGAVPAIAGIASQMTVTVAAAGTMALAFHGVGGALKALNDYQLQPTAAHLAAMQVAMQKIGPAGEQFVRFLDQMQNRVGSLSTTARAGMFPGLESGLTHLLTLMPQVRTIVSEMATGLGQLADEAGKNLAGPKFQGFFQWLETDAKPILLDMGRTVGNLAEGLANLLVAFAPQSMGFSHGLLEMARSFAEWSRTLDTNQGFQHFLDYTTQAGPKALEFLGSLIHIGTALIKAWAPLGSATLPILTDFVNILAKLVDTPLGPTTLGVLALASAFGRLKAIGELANTGVFTAFGKFSNGLIAQTKLAQATIPTMTQLGNATMHSMHSQKQLNESFGTSIKYGEKNAQVAIQSRNAVTSFARALAPAGIAVAGFALLVSGQADKLDLTNTAALTLAGTMFGPLGTGLGFATGAFLDARSASASYKNSLDALTTASAEANRKQLEALRQQAQAAYDNRSFMERLGNKASQGIGAALHAFSGTGINLKGFSAADQDAQDLQATLAILDGRLRLIGSHSRPGLTLLTQTLGITNHAARALVGGMQDVEKAFVHMSDVLAGRAAMRDFQQAIDDATKALHKNGRTLDINVQKGRDNQAALDAIANTSIAVAEHLKGMDRQRFLVNARKDFIDAAEKMGMTDKAARALADKLGLLGRPHPVTVDNNKANKGLDDTTNKAKYLDGLNPHFMVGVDDGQALAALRAIAAGLNALRDKTVTVTTRHVTGGSVKMGNAYGGYISGPGGPRDDSIPSWLSNGEFVVNAYSTARHRALLEKINAQQYAYGGMVSAQSAGRSRLTVDVGDLRVTGTLDSALGPVKIEGIARAAARSEIDADRDYDMKRANQ